MQLTDVSEPKINPTLSRQGIRDDGARGLILDRPANGSEIMGGSLNRAGRVLKTTIGPYPAVSLADARRQALQIAAAVARGADPQHDKKAARASVTIRSVRMIADEFLVHHTTEKNGERWAAETKRILEKNILPLIDDSAIGAVGKLEILDVLRAKHNAPIAAMRLAGRGLVNEFLKTLFMGGPHACRAPATRMSG